MAKRIWKRSETSRSKTRPTPEPRIWDMNQLNSGHAVFSNGYNEVGLVIHYRNRYCGARYLLVSCVWERQKKPQNRSRFNMSHSYYQLDESKYQALEGASKLRTSFNTNTHGEARLKKTFSPKKVKMVWT